MKNLILCALALAPALAFPAGSFAATTPQAASGFDESLAVPVRFRDLDLVKTADAAKLLGRIRNAALAACGAPDGSLREYRLSIAEGSCFKAGVARAVAEVNAPALTRLYSGRGVVTIARN